MTLEELRSYPIDTVFLCQSHGRVTLEPFVLVEKGDVRDVSNVLMRRLGHTYRLVEGVLKKIPYRAAQRWCSQIICVAPTDALTANVYADWLEENDEPTAAEKLRKAFPTSDDTRTRKGVR